MTSLDLSTLIKSWISINLRLVAHLVKILLPTLACSHRFVSYLRVFLNRVLEAITPVVLALTLKAVDVRRAQVTVSLKSKCTFYPTCMCNVMYAKENAITAKRSRYSTKVNRSTRF